MSDARLLRRLAPGQTLRGAVRVPGDRSITVRAVLLGALGSGVTEARGALDSDDTRAAVRCVRALGVQVEPGEPGDGGLRIHGRGLHGLTEPSGALDCGSSGATLRLLAGIAAGQRFACTLDGSDQLRRRPMRRVAEPLRAMGARVAATDDRAPLRFQPAALTGAVHRMIVASAQVKSALLLAGLFAPGETSVVEPVPTRDHTERLLQAAGVRLRSVPTPLGTQITVEPPAQPLLPLTMSIPGDFSSAAFFLIAGILIEDSEIEILNTGLNPTRTALLTALAQLGARVETGPAASQGGEPVGTLRPRPSRLHGARFDGALVAGMIDELPILAVAATQAHGVTEVRGAAELRVKESDRIAALVTELRKLGARIEEYPDGFRIEGPTKLRGAALSAYEDHRIAMSLAVAALIADGDTTLSGADCVSKTYPNFFAQLDALIT